MYIRIVTFRLEGPSDGEFRRHAEMIAPAFTEWPGLDAKIWLGDPDTGTYGGVYLFASAEAAAASRSTELFTGMEANPAFRDLTIREFDVLDAPTAITAGALLV